MPLLGGYDLREDGAARLGLEGGRIIHCFSAGPVLTFGKSVWSSSGGRIPAPDAHPDRVGRREVQGLREFKPKRAAL
jgi:hypothetical protein